MGNFLEGTESGLKQKTLAEKIADTASVNLSTESWTEKNYVAGKALDSFQKLDGNGDGVLSDVDFELVERRFGQFYQSERNASKFLQSNYYAIRDLNKETCECNENVNDRGITRADLRQFYDISTPDFNPKSAVVWDTLGRTGWAMANTAFAAWGVWYSIKTGAPSAFAPIIGTGGVLTLGATVREWTKFNENVADYNDKRKGIGGMSFPKNFE